MPFFDPAERARVKSFLNSVLDSKDLKEQFEKASKQAKVECQDHRAAMLGQYAGILKEIIDDRAKPVDLTGTVQGPSLEQLKKKFLGPKK
jgi:cell division septum initiation protein DivIVA